MKKPGEKLALCAAALGLVIAGLVIALQSGTSQQRTASLDAFREAAPEDLLKYVPAEKGPAVTDAPALESAEKPSASETIAAFESFWPKLALHGVGGSLWVEIDSRTDKYQDDPYDDKEIARMRLFVAKNQEFLAEIKRLAELGGPVADLDLSQGMAVELNHLAKLREMGRMLCVEALVLAKDGDFAGAAEDILLSMKLGDALAGEPILICQLVRMAAYSAAFDTIRDALPAGACPPEALDALLVYTVQADHRDSFADCMSGEGVLGLVEFGRLRQDGVRYNFGAELGAGSDYVGQIASAIYTSPLGTPWVNMDEAAYADIMARMAEASELPYYEADPILSEIEADVEALPVTRFVSRALLPALGRAACAQAGHEARLDLMQLGLLVEQHHAEHGEYPESLNALTGSQQPLDPFSGAPYRYVLSEDGFTLYSLGRNMTDEGGRHHFHEGDIVWRGVETRE